MTQSKYIRPDFTVQAASTWKANLDNALETNERGSGKMFQGHEEDTPVMTVRLESGALFDLGASTLTEVAAQSTGTITAPTTNPRIDRVVVDKSTGVVSVITGAENVSPVAPTITANKFPVCQVALLTSTTAIFNADITDERTGAFVQAGAAGGLNNIVEDTTPQLGGNLDPNGNSIADSNNNEILSFGSVASAVNGFTLTNAATGNAPTSSVTGDDLDIDYPVMPKGTGQFIASGIKYPNSAGSAGQLVTSNGVDFVLANPSSAFEFVSSTGIANDSVIDFTDLNDSTASYIFVLNGIRPVDNNSSLGMRTSTDNGSSFASSGYTSLITATKVVGTAESTDITGDTGDTLMVITSNASGFEMTNSVSHKMSGTVEIINPFESNSRTHVHIKTTYNQVSSTMIVSEGGGIRNADAAVNAVRFLMDSGNLSSGTIKLYKRRGS